eukprot:CAMPEP_0114578386 /NCGR_PEP_ID=MMETSP0125-20121206/2930_1 /TAXON_ID=485358 ORGANISM="Aristerostoma sp., Strain ATCC 50986" /NCGR_SAMPLE_ID=MMETSP0125 /ASSEMBLY_ACC=CAM_ASM_000245 /LENGTH=69 /DNA_ID=CAMNT_0001768413 /DNA_START=1923 /DNA_END=2132 /DNA_ORIENTATION=+
MNYYNQPPNNGTPNNSKMLQPIKDEADDESDEYYFEPDVSKKKHLDGLNGNNSSQLHNSLSKDYINKML